MVSYVSLEDFLSYLHIDYYKQNGRYFLIDEFGEDDFDNINSEDGGYDTIEEIVDTLQYYCINNIYDYYYNKGYFNVTNPELSPIGLTLQILYSYICRHVDPYDDYDELDKTAKIWHKDVLRSLINPRYIVDLHS